MTPSPDQIAARPLDHLTRFGREHPRAWSELETVRAVGMAGERAWPDWCYCPSLHGIKAVGGMGALAGLLAAGPAAPIAPWLAVALAAWRYTKGVYLFDDHLRAALMATPITGDIPAALLQRLPEWCVYIATPGLIWDGDIPCAGFFAHLEHDPMSGRDELRIVLDLDEADGPALRVMPVGLGGDLKGGLADARTLPGQESADWPKQDREMVGALAPLVSLLLYLCSEEAEVGDGAARPARPRAKRTKKGEKLFAAKQPALWVVGARIGAALRRGLEAAPAADAP
ncbi:AcrVA2 family anti-CRISPR protein, partial [Magnetofaba australis]|uniref:AcrVA2 family anti-CRISPR protein n=1 Tax=Magnetofaba australis TaxID=1472297 RepID=UPI000A19BAFA